MESPRKVILYIAMSLDGYIAGEGDNLDFLSTIDSPGEDYGYFTFIHQIDTLIWGRKTYDMVLSFGVDFPHPGKKVYVISKSRQGSDEHVEYVSDLPSLITKLKKEEGKHIYCDGGGEIVLELLKHSLIDEMIISIIPHLLGGGKRLFLDGRPEQHLQMTKCTPYASGLVQLKYERKVH